MILTLYQFHLIKQRRLNREITNLRFEYHRLQRLREKSLRKRNQLLTHLLLMIDDAIYLNPRVCWSYSKSHHWWSVIVPSMNERQFKENFRLQRSTFKDLVQQVGPLLQRSDTHLRSAIPVDKRIACALYSLGSTSELRTIANLFGIGRSTAAGLIHEFCSIVVQMFFHRLIRFPSTDPEIAETIQDFLQIHQYPMCIGCLDGTHIPIKAPLGMETDYYNYKKYHSIIMLAVVNASLQFTYVNVGAPGRCNDSSVYTRSTLFDVVQHDIYAKQYLNMGGRNVQAHLIADSAFPISQTLMKPYPEKTNMPRQQSLFNYRLSRTRCAVERAFGGLKNRFRCLHKKLEYDINNSINIIKATTIIHNLCVINHDGIEVEWNLLEPVYKKLACNVHAAGGNAIRDALADYFVNNPL
jgi:hypothetical protein